MMGIKHFGTENYLTTSGVLQELYQTHRLALHCLKSRKGKNKSTILNRHQCKHSQERVDKIIYIHKN